MKWMYPGSFDPITNGHIDIIRRAAALCDELVVVVLDNREKQSAFSLEDRLDMTRKVVADIPNVVVDSYAGLTTDYIAANDVSVIIRGVRNTIDFDYEAGLSEIFKTQGVDVETVFIPANPSLAYLSSTVVRQHVALGGDITKFVPEEILPTIKALYRE